MNSVRVGGKRYFPGDIVELTEEQASRLNSDIFVNLDSVAPMKEPEPMAIDVSVVEAPKFTEIQPIKRVGKRSGKTKP